MIKRITHKIERDGTLHHLQFGFREQSATTDALATALEVVREAKTKGYQCLAISLDIRAAFDNAWWPALFSQLKNLECPKNIYRLLLSYIQDRVVSLDFADSSASKTMSKGCIQGSACGPMLWNIILNDLLRLSLPHSAHIQAFADDVLLIVQGRSKEDVQATATTCLRAIHDWGVSVKLAFAPEKTQAISFTAKTKAAEVFMNGFKIPILDEIKLLGVIIDSRLNFIKHANYVLSKATKLFKNLCRFVKPTWGIHPQNVETIYQRVIIPMITYAAGIWGSATQFYSVRRALRAFQRAFAIRCIRGFRTLSAVAAEALSQLPPLHLVVNEAYDLHKIKRIGTSEDLPDDIELYRRAKVRDMLHPAERITIKYDEATTQDETDALMDPDGTNIFTDGSKLDSGDTGAAFAAMAGTTPILIRKFKLARTSSVFMAELYAIKQAILWSGNKKPATIRIFSDSQSALKAISDRSNTDPIVHDIHKLIHQFKSAGKSIHFTWIKAHVGIVGNEVADTAAKAAATNKTATRLNYFPLSHAKRQIKQRTLQLWQEDYAMATQGTQTKHFFPTIQDIAEFRNKIGLTFNITQIVSGHGYNKSYLKRFNITSDDLCPCDSSSIQDTKHILQDCPLFWTTRQIYEDICKFKNITPYNLLETIKNDRATEKLINHINAIVNNLKRINGT